MFNPSDAFEVDPGRAAGDVIDGEAIIINLATGAYYSMLGIGGEIWSMIDERRRIGEMVEAITATYEVAPDVARTDLEAVLEQMVEEGLIRFSATADSAATRAVPEMKRPYRQPVLQVFRDMEELLALDPPAPGMNRIAWSSNSAK